ncbi:MAG: adenylyltransferase/cytidyltransferase family protein, partial [Novibacillus thermophilus]
MEVIHIRYPLEDEIVMAIQPSVVAIGTFDGVHLGHRHVLDRTKRLSARLHCPPAAMTFDPHPRAVLSSDRSFQYLTPLREKLLQFERAGMELTYVVHFDRQLAAVSPRGFVDDGLV